MAEPANTGMKKADMRKMLQRSTDEGMGCAVGVGDDAKVGLFVMHRIKRGKALEQLLKTDFPTARNVRFGTAFVDPEEDPKLVKLQLNRSAPGIAKRLIKTLKGTGFNKVIIVTDDGETEGFEEADEEAPVADDTAAAAPPPTPAAPPPPAAAATPEEIAAKTAALGKALAALAAGIPKAAAGDDARKAVLLKLATDANVQIKTGNLKAAGGFVAQLKAALEAPASGASAPDGATTADKLKQVRLAWTGMQQQVQADVDKLAGALAAAYAGSPVVNEIAARFRAKSAPVLARFDNRLTAAIDRVVGAQDEAGRRLSISEARTLIREYLSFAMTDPAITDLDDNPFVKLSIRSRTTTALAAAAAAMPG